MPRPLPDALDDLRAQIDALDARATAIVSSLSASQLVWRPDDGSRWSIAQCLEHLQVVDDVYLRGVEAAVARATAKATDSFQALRPSILARWFIRQQEPPVRRRVPAPRAVRIASAEPATMLTPSACLAAYVASHGPYRALLDACAHVDVNRVVVPNPFLPGVRMRVSTVLLLLPAHGRRHLWQAEQVRQMPGFPG